MGENSKIEWTDHTWNPWLGCTKISPACDGCYAEAMMDKRYGRVQWGNHPRVRTSKSTWDSPLKWNRKAEAEGTRPFVFSSSLSDIFDNQVPSDWRSEAFAVMRKTPRLVYLLLTKRPQNIVKLASAAGGLPSNAALGTTVEDQQRADMNLPALDAARRETSPLFTFGSFEPLLGPVVIPPSVMPDWIITGGETDQGGHKARPTHPDWFRSLRDQARRAGVPFHHKQNGEWFAGELGLAGGPGYDEACRAVQYMWDDGYTTSLRVGKKHSGRMIDGVTHDEFPVLRAIAESWEPASC